VLGQACANYGLKGTASDEAVAHKAIRVPLLGASQAVLAGWVVGGGGRREFGLKGTASDEAVAHKAVRVPLLGACQAVLAGWVVGGGSEGIRSEGHCF